MTSTSALIAIIIMSLVTILLRGLPFVVFGRKDNTPAWLMYLGRVLPYAVMGMLVVYCLKGVSFTSAGGFLPELIAGALTAGTYVWKKNSLISILAGTVCYMLLVQLVF